MTAPLALAAEDIKQFFAATLPTGEQPPDIALSGGRLEISSVVLDGLDISRIGTIARYHGLIWAIYATDDVPHLIIAPVTKAHLRRMGTR